jgi:hypothetical protein
LSTERRCGNDWREPGPSAAVSPRSPLQLPHACRTDPGCAAARTISTQRSTKECISWKPRWRGTRLESRPEVKLLGPTSHVKFCRRAIVYTLRRLDYTILSPPSLSRGTATEVAMSSRATRQPLANSKSFLSDIAWFGFRLGFGLTSLASVWVTAVLKNGVLWARDTAEEKRELAAAQKKHWGLDGEPLPGFRHAFFFTSTGTRLHYVMNTDAETSTADPQSVAIFVHGMSHRAETR